MMLTDIAPAILSVTILVLFWIMPTLVPATIPFGVRIPSNRQHEAVISQVRFTYYIGLVIIAIIVELGAFLLTQILQTYAIFLAAIIIELLLGSLNYMIAHYRLRRAKEQGQWYAGLHQAVVADTNTPPVEPLPIFWIIAAILPLLLVIILSIIRYPMLPATIPTHFGIDGQPNQWMSKTVGIWLLPLISLLVTALLIFMALQLPKHRMTLDPEDIEGSRQRTATQIKLWRPLLLVTAGLINLNFLYTSLITLEILPPGDSSFRLVSAISIVLVVFIIFSYVRSVRINSINQANKSQATSRYVHRDDDRYWIGGLIYVNKDDPSVFVEKRFGLGRTINLGHPVGILCIALLVLLVIGIKLLSQH